uniref:OSJNBa0027O01.5 protein n=1 Tax=Oryza sativa subsp. japonica TaxID=39947 RepID=Q7XXC0_ORYSJ|nr:OSJNBa0027O01.5 [Oryza sativa Japonica Group]
MAGAAAAVAGEGRSGVGQAEGGAQPQSTVTRSRGMTATSRPMRSVAAAFVLTTSPALNHLSFPFAHHHCHSVVPRWRPARCRAKPAVEDVVDDEKEKETWRREDKPEGKDGGEEVLGRGWFMVDEIGMDILTIALPAVLALATDPITALISTSFVGHVVLDNLPQQLGPQPLVCLLRRCSDEVRLLRRCLDEEKGEIKRTERDREKREREDEEGKEIDNDMWAPHGSHNYYF